MPADLCFLSSVELAGHLRKKEISAREVLTAHLDQIERVNPKMNVIMTLTSEQALVEADRSDSAMARGEIAGQITCISPPVCESMSCSARWWKP